MIKYIYKHVYVYDMIYMYICIKYFFRYLHIWYNIYIYMINIYKHVYLYDMIYIYIYKYEYIYFSRYSHIISYYRWTTKESKSQSVCHQRMSCAYKSIVSSNTKGGHLWRVDSTMQTWNQPYNCQGMWAAFSSILLFTGKKKVLLQWRENICETTSWFNPNSIPEISRLLNYF